MAVDLLRKRDPSRHQEGRPVDVAWKRTTSLPIRWTSAGQPAPPQLRLLPGVAEAGDVVGRRVERYTSHGPRCPAVRPGQKLVRDEQIGRAPSTKRSTSLRRLSGWMIGVCRIMSEQLPAIGREAEETAFLVSIRLEFRGAKAFRPLPGATARSHHRSRRGPVPAAGGGRGKGRLCRPSRFQMAWLAR